MHLSVSINNGELSTSSERYDRTFDFYHLTAPRFPRFSHFPLPGHRLATYNDMSLGHRR